MDRVVVGITGASGIPYGIRLLEVLKEFDVEVHLTCSPSASLVNDHEGDGRFDAPGLGRRGPRCRAGGQL